MSTGSDDFMHDLLVSKQAGDFPYEFRRSTNTASEVTYASAHTLLLVNETLSVAAVLDAGLTALKGKRFAPVHKELAQKIRHSESARALLNGVRYPLNSIVVVNMCAALEAGIEDTVLVSLRFKPGLVDRLLSLGLKNATAPSDRDLTFEEARAVYRQLEEWKSEQLKRLPTDRRKPPEGWLTMLRAVDLPVDLSSVHRESIAEMLYIRNCIVHRGGRTDRATGAAGSDVAIQRRLRVEKDAMRRFSDAALALASGIAQAALAPVLGAS